MICFGPAGNSEAFYNEGYKKTVDVFPWLAAKGLDAYEYQCGRGVNVKEETARAIGEAARSSDIRISLHAPYYINLAGTEREKLEKSYGHIEKSLKAAVWMGADRVVVHPGGLGKDSRDAAMKRALSVFSDILKTLENAHMICPELMGKVNQLGNLEDIIKFCRADERIIPTIDFGHLNARTKGSLDTEEAFGIVIRKLADGIGWERTRKLHVHFSRIEFSEKGGEKRHWTFNDTQYGPDFNDFLPVIIRDRLEPVIICESSGTQTEDAVYMKERYASCV